LLLSLLQASERAKRVKIRCNCASQLLGRQNTDTSKQDKKGMSKTIVKILTTRQLNTRIQLSKLSVEITTQKIDVVVAGGGWRKIAQFGAIRIANTTQSIDEIIDSLTFTSSKLRGRLSVCNCDKRQHKKYQFHSCCYFERKKRKKKGFKIVFNFTVFELLGF
jgi:hypothetical protein